MLQIFAYTFRLHFPRLSLRMFVGFYCVRSLLRLHKSLGNADVPYEVGIPCVLFLCWPNELSPWLFYGLIQIFLEIFSVKSESAPFYLLTALIQKIVSAKQLLLRSVIDASAGAQNLFTLTVQEVFFLPYWRTWPDLYRGSWFQCRICCSMFV